MEYEELRISAAYERKKRIDEVNKKIPRVAEIDREIFKCGMENTKRIFKIPIRLMNITGILKKI